MVDIPKEVARKSPDAGDQAMQKVAREHWSVRDAGQVTDRIASGVPQYDAVLDRASTLAARLAALDPQAVSQFFVNNDGNYYQDENARLAQRVLLDAMKSNPDVQAKLSC
jgi:hypothetical protein